MLKLNMTVCRYYLRGILLFLIIGFSSLHAQDVPGVSVAPDSVAIADSLTAQSDSLSKLSAVKPLIPIENIGINAPNFINTVINNSQCDFNEFRSSGDVLTNYLPVQKNDFGIYGHPDFFYFYGTSRPLILTDNLSGSSIVNYNFYDVSLTGIKSIKVSSPVTGFLYGNNMRGVAINFIRKDIYPEKPITQIQYFQAPNDEGEINIFFARKFSKRIIFSYNVSNKSVTSNFKNSDFSYWSGFSRLKYLVNRNINLSFTYSYLHSTVGLNGGVDFDSIKGGSFGNDYNAILYNNYLAPVVFPDRYLKTTKQKLEFSLTSKISNSDFFFSRIYYDDNLGEFRSNEKRENYSNHISTIINDTEEKKIGFDFMNSLTTDLINFKLLGNYENLKVSSPMFFESETMNNFSLSGIVSRADTTSKFNPELFQRALNYNGKWFIGYGAAVGFSPLKNISLRGGISKYEKPYSLYSRIYSTNNGSDVLSSELSVKFLFGNSFLRITNFYLSEKNALFAYSTEPEKQYYHPELIKYASTDKSTMGVNLYTEIHVNKLELSVNATYQKNDSYNGIEVSPELFANAGLFYIDSLFSNNLFLKAGFNFYFTGKQNYLFYNFQSGDAVRFYENSLNSIVPFDYPQTEDNFTLDFFMCGRIQERANIYFIFENLTDKEYFVVPYYPKQSRGVRFGIKWDIYN